VALPLDVTDQASIIAAAAAAADTTMVINNAGISPIPDRILSDDMRDIRKTFETNFFGALAVARAFAPVLGANGGGALLHVHSVLSWIVGDPDGQAGGHGAYSASKSALWSATNSLRLALAHQHTHVLGLHFGYTDTPMTAQIIDDNEDAADIVRAAYSALLAGEYEVSADNRSRNAKQTLRPTRRPLPTTKPYRHYLTGQTPAPASGGALDLDMPLPCTDETSRNTVDDLLSLGRAVPRIIMEPVARHRILDVPDGAYPDGTPLDAWQRNAFRIVCDHHHACGPAHSRRRWTISVSNPRRRSRP
jgi:NAD(P)-dependent dehydrogenase (short-subunit alcohol dehydrogenase family)